MSSGKLLFNCVKQTKNVGPKLLYTLLLIFGKIFRSKEHKKEVAKKIGWKTYQFQTVVVIIRDFPTENALLLFFFHLIF